MQGRETTCSARSSRQNNSAGTDVSLPIQTAGELFDDGHLIELVGDAGSMWLLLSDGDRQSVASRVTHRGRSYSPLDFDRSILQALTLPTRMAPRESTRKLFDDARELFQSYDFPEDVALRATYFSFATWFSGLPTRRAVLRGHRTNGGGSFAVRTPRLLGAASSAVGESLSGGPLLPPTATQSHTARWSSACQQTRSTTLLASTVPNSYLACGTGIVNLFGPRAVYWDPHSTRTFLKTHSSTYIWGLRSGACQSSTPALDRQSPRTSSRDSSDIASATLLRCGLLIGSPRALSRSSGFSQGLSLRALSKRQTYRLPSASSFRDSKKMSERSAGSTYAASRSRHFWLIAIAKAKRRPTLAQSRRRRSLYRRVAARLLHSNRDAWVAS